MSPTKICCRCERDLPRSAFYPLRRKNGTHGSQSSCIECHASRRRGQSPEERRRGALANFRARFWSYIDKRGPAECWPWTGYKHAGFGYGMISIAGQKAMLYSHRVALEIAGVVIPEGMGALHTCDNPPCCNPAHLYPGTQKDNVRDMVERGRARGRSRRVA